MTHDAFCDPRFWVSVIGTLALVGTVIFLIIYTKAAQKTAEYTARQFRKMSDPVVRARLWIPEDLEPQDATVVVDLHNSSSNHALAEVRLTATIWGKKGVQVPHDAYRAKSKWLVQSGGHVQGDFFLKDLINVLPHEEYLKALDGYIKGSAQKAYQGIMNDAAKRSRISKYPEHNFPPHLTCLPPESFRLHLHVTYWTWTDEHPQQRIELPTLSYHLRYLQNVEDDRSALQAVAYLVTSDDG